MFRLFFLKFILIYEACASLEQGNEAIYDEIISFSPKLNIVMTQEHRREYCNTVPSGVTELPDSCFQNCLEISKMSLPETLEKIGSHCFKECLNLKRLYIPRSVRKIGSYFIDGCRSLETVQISNYVNDYFTKIYHMVVNKKTSTIFLAYNNHVLYMGDLPVGVEFLDYGGHAIPREPFFSYDAFDKILSSGVTIDVSSFLPYCITKVTLSEGINEELMLNNMPYLQKVIIDDGVRKVPDMCFKDNKLLTDVTLYEGISELGIESFCGCNIKELDIPNGTIKIGQKCFADNVDLFFVNLPLSLTIENIGDNCFSGCVSKMLHVNSYYQISKFDKDRIGLPDSCTIRINNKEYMTNMLIGGISSGLHATNFLEKNA